MQAIVTRYHGATNTQQSRISARTQGRKLFVKWDHDLNIDQNHDAAAYELARQLGWDKYGRIVGGGMPDGTGNAYVIVTP